MKIIYPVTIKIEPGENLDPEMIRREIAEAIEIHKANTGLFLSENKQGELESIVVGPAQGGGGTIIVSGGPSGFRFHGPFYDQDESLRWADANVKDSWWNCDLEDPNE
jgi:hypothetical protein